MNNLPKHFKLNLTTKAEQKAMVTGKNYRFTVLTDRLIRMEYDESGAFEDRATQCVFNRKFPVPKFTVTENGDEITIKTKYVCVCYKKEQPFDRYTLWVGLLGQYQKYENRWYYGDTVGQSLIGNPKVQNLGGTIRTLDRVDGKTQLGDGLCSILGVSTIDDSKSLVLKEDGFVEARAENICDTYFFGYGKDYLGCIKDFYRLTGAPPLLPKYALGNWWSRYYKYTQEEYIQLIERFEQEDLPFSVAVIDMDWHLVDIPKELGRGWTGYTWDKDLFPDYKAFLKWLHKHGLKTSLNLHPADGVRCHEDMYPQMAEAMGIDPKTKQAVEFDASSEKFWDEYFKVLHHPYEKDGVDFWWMDWQQGNASPLKGLDPLWMLNHYHTLDIQRTGKRPLLFSRYAGPGSHRYPVGFSGDTVISWDSLNFQPYFTATASNIGYSWWSHDIGGHYHGTHDDELTARWTQFGVFSPINRLHSSRSRYTGKEPWKYCRDTCESMQKFLRLRHSLVPYIYTMSYRNYEQLIPLMQPMYYSHPDSTSAYTVANQYWFGSEMIVAPITTKADSVTRLGKVTAWLPKGTWVDFFTGVVYAGDRKIDMYRDLDTMPVLCKAGAIVPTYEHMPYDNSLDNPVSMQARVFSGDNGSFTLYEDEGDNKDYLQGKFATTDITLKWGEKAIVTIDTPKGDLSVLPTKRQWSVLLTGFAKDIAVTAKRNGKKCDCTVSYDTNSHTTTVMLATGEATDTLTLEITGGMFDNGDWLERCESTMLGAYYSHDIKDSIYAVLTKDLTLNQKISAINALQLDSNLLSALLEILTAQ